MKAIRIHETGGPEVMKLEDVDIPKAKTDEVIIKNDYASVNFIDIYFRTGLYPVQFPTTLGRDGAGVVSEVGENVKDFQVGDRVAYAAATPGSYAEYVTSPASKVYKLPDSISTKEGANMMISGLTAQALLRSVFPINSSHTILIHAGAGGLGQLVIQMAKIIGAKVITTVSSEEKADICRKLGADHVINYTSITDFASEVRRLTNGQGVNVVYDAVGKNTWEGSLNSLRPLGYLVLCGNASGPVPPIDPLSLSTKGSLFLTRPTLNNYISTREEFVKRCDEVFSWLQDGKLAKPTFTEFPLADAAKAHELLNSRQSTGKILLHASS